MEIGISYWFGYPSFAKERVKLLRKYGFKNVSLHWTDEYIDVTGSKIIIPDILYDNGIEISSFHMSYDVAHYLWENNKEGINYRESLFRAVDDACHFNVPIIVIHTNGKINGLTALEYLYKVIDYAKKNEIIMCVENLQIEDNLSMIMNAEYGRDIFLCYDTGHANIRKCPYKVECNENVRYVHINDNHSLSDEHLLPHKGNVEWQRELEVLRTLENANAILEVHGNLNNVYEAEMYLSEASEIGNKLKSEL